MNKWIHISSDVFFIRISLNYCIWISFWRQPCSLSEKTFPFINRFCLFVFLPNCHEDGDDAADGVRSFQNKFVLKLSWWLNLFRL